MRHDKVWLSAALVLCGGCITERNGGGGVGGGNLTPSSGVSTAASGTGGGAGSGGSMGSGGGGSVGSGGGGSGGGGSSGASALPCGLRAVDDPADPAALLEVPAYMTDPQEITLSGDRVAVVGIASDRAFGWMLKSTVTGETLARGPDKDVLLRGNTLLVGRKSVGSLSLYNAIDGQMEAQITTPHLDDDLASDGSYLWLQDNSGIHVLSTSGSALFDWTAPAATKMTGRPWGAPGALRIPTGTLLKTILVTAPIDGTAATSAPAVQGSFQHWLEDGESFVTAIEGTTGNLDKCLLFAKDGTALGGVSCAAHGAKGYSWISDNKSTAVYLQGRRLRGELRGLGRRLLLGGDRHLPGDELGADLDRIRPCAAVREHVERAPAVAGLRRRRVCLPPPRVRDEPDRRRRLQRVTGRYAPEPGRARRRRAERAELRSPPQPQWLAVGEGRDQHSGGRDADLRREPGSLQPEAPPDGRVRSSVVGRRLPARRRLVVPRRKP